MDRIVFLTPGRMMAAQVKGVYVTLSNDSYSLRRTKKNVAQTAASIQEGGEDSNEYI